VLAFGEQWRASAPLFGWMSVAYVAQSAFWLGQNLSFATRHSARAVRLSIAQLCLSAALGAALIPFGMVGVAAGFALGSVAGCIAMQMAVRRQLGLSWAELARAGLPALLGVGAAALALWVLPQLGLDEAHWRGLILALGLGFACYAAIALLVHWLMRRRASA
jgi:O-antigen/teichoic acid export membrane protein